MAEFVDESGVLREFRVYPCPNCREAVNNKMAQCPFCNSLLDHGDQETLDKKLKEIKNGAMMALGLSILSILFLGFVLARPIFRYANSVAVEVNIYEVGQKYRTIARISQVIVVISSILWIIGIFARAFGYL